MDELVIGMTEGRQHFNSNNSAFTIVELLIVIVVIAILAAVSVVAYTGVQNRAINATVEADIATIVKKMELVRVDLGHYPHSTGEFPADFKFTKSAYNQTANNIYYIVDKTNDRYALGLRAASGRGYIVTSEGVIANAGTINSTTTADAIDVAWGSNTDDNYPPLKWVTQGFTGSSSNWSSAWPWTS